jgi:prepilin-type N-terminal cleavage/methylation domain-containing protein
MPGFQRIRRARAQRRSSGFTLVELLTVVAIVGILAAIAVVLVARYFRHSKSVEAITMISSIRAAQEMYKGDNGAYLNATSTSLWFPTLPDGDVKHSFVVADGVHVDAARWRQLAVSKTDGTQFGFRAYAGLAGPVSVVTDTTASLPFPTAKEDWYVIEAGGDLTDSSPALSLYVAASWTSELYIENEGE